MGKSAVKSGKRHKLRTLGLLLLAVGTQKNNGLQIMGKPTNVFKTKGKKSTTHREKLFKHYLQCR